jgi:dihydrofolate reductase
MISIIAACSKNRVIGNDNSLIWYLPADLKHFKTLTINKTIVMGRKTFESIGKPLPNRRNIIITRDESYLVDGCEVVNSIPEALLLCNSDCFFIGGGEIYKQVLEQADVIYLTEIDEYFQGDAEFPLLDSKWHEISRSENLPDDKNKFKYSFIVYERYEF